MICWGGLSLLPQGDLSLRPQDDRTFDDGCWGGLMLPEDDRTCDDGSLPQDVQVELRQRILRAGRAAAVMLTLCFSKMLVGQLCTYAKYKWTDGMELQSALTPRWRYGGTASTPSVHLHFPSVHRQYTRILRQRTGRPLHLHVASVHIQYTCIFN